MLLDNKNNKVLQKRKKKGKKLPAGICSFLAGIRKRCPPLDKLEKVVLPSLPLSAGSLSVWPVQLCVFEYKL